MGNGNDWNLKECINLDYMILHNTHGCIYIWGDLSIYIYIYTPCKEHRLTSEKRRSFSSLFHYIYYISHLFLNLVSF